VKPGRRLVIGWETVIVRHPVAYEATSAETNVIEDQAMASSKASGNNSSSVEIPD
jgi:hypothetical protein